MSKKRKTSINITYIKVFIDVSKIVKYIILLIIFLVKIYLKK